MTSKRSPDLLSVRCQDEIVAGKDIVSSITYHYSVCLLFACCSISKFHFAHILVVSLIYINFLSRKGKHFHMSVIQPN